MHISRYTDYAFRVLLFVGANRKRCTLSEISEYYNISLEHLRKVVHNLSLLDYVNTYKGKNGGIEINFAPEEINLGNIYRDFEHQKEEIIDCSKNMCPLTPKCKLRNALFNAEQAFIRELDQFTLADILNKPTINLIRSCTSS